MAKFNLDYFKGDLDKSYTDGSVEQEILVKIREGKSPDEILAENNDWPYLYHLSHRRENILNWYPFKKDSTILEIGSGCGALTGLLASRAKQVTSIELTKMRAEINFERHKDLDNVEIIVGNFNEIELDEKYDYIILNGVLEYAGSFTDYSDDPYKTFLENIKKFLKDDGVLLIAIENRIGLKYLNGAPEEHRNSLFLGMDDYQDVTDVKTFTRSELHKLLDSVGLNHQRFYYPFPDYKLPEEILTEETFKLANPEELAKNLNSPRVYLYNEQKMFQTLVREGLGPDFSNSFLVAASKEKLKDTNISYASVSDSRKDKFATITTIEGDTDKIVRKRPLYDGEDQHLKQMINFFNEVDDPTFNYTKAVEDGDSVLFDYIEGEKFDKKLIKLIKERKIDELKAELNFLKDYLFEASQIVNDYNSEGFVEVFGDAKTDREMHVKENNNIDLIFSNIIDSGDKPTVIDYEWLFNFKIPQEFILFRSLYNLYYQNVEIQNLITLEELLDLVDLDHDLIETFKEWDEHFGNVYVNKGKENFKNQMSLNGQELLGDTLAQQSNLSSLYLNFENDFFRENNRIKQTLNPNPATGEFEIHFDLTPVLSVVDDELVEIRWDPVETDCILEDLDITTDDGEKLDFYLDDPKSSDFVLSDGKITFLNSDPYLYLYFDNGNIKGITIKGKYTEVNRERLQDITFKFNNRAKEAEKKTQEVTDELKLAKFKELEYLDKIANLEEEVAELTSQRDALALQQDRKSLKGIARRIKGRLKR